MAHHITFAGDNNQGPQVGHNSGAIYIAAPGKCRSRLDQRCANCPLSPQNVRRLHQSPRASCRSAATLITSTVERCLTSYVSDAPSQPLVLRWLASAGWGRSSDGNLRSALASNTKYRKSQLAIEHCCERPVGTVFQLPNPDAIYSRDEGKGKRRLQPLVVRARARPMRCWGKVSDHCRGKVRDRREGSD